MIPDDSTELFKQAVTSTMRAISGNDELQVSFGRGKPYLQGNRARIPLPDGGMTTEQLASLRGNADKFALQTRFHDDDLHRKSRPVTGISQEIYDAIKRQEQADAELAAKESASQSPPVTPSE